MCLRVLSVRVCLFVYSLARDVVVDIVMIGKTSRWWSTIVTGQPLVGRSSWWWSTIGIVANRRVVWSTTVTGQPSCSWSTIVIDRSSWWLSTVVVVVELSHCDWSIVVVNHCTWLYTLCVIRLSAENLVGLGFL